MQIVYERNNSEKYIGGVVLFIYGVVIKKSCKKVYVGCAI